MRKKLSLLFISFGLLLAVTAQAAGFTSRIAVLRVNGGHEEPFTKPFKVNTADYDASSLTTPFLVSTAGRYIWSSAPLEIEFTGDELIIGSDVEEVKAVSGGRTLRAAYTVCCLRNLLRTEQGDASRPSPSADFFNLPLYDTGHELPAPDAASLADYAAQIVQHGFPAGILLVGDGWQASDGSFMFDPEYFADPRTLIADLHAKGFKVMLTVNPYVPAAGRNFRNPASGRFLCGADGRPTVVSNASGYHLCLDPGNPDEAARMRAQLAKLRAEYGVDGFLFDAGTVKGWASLGEGIVLCEYAPGFDTPFTPYINGLPAGSPFDWEFLASGQADILSAGLVGYPFCRPLPADGAGSSDDPRLLLRYLQQAAAMPVMNIGFAPWRVASGADLGPFREAVRLRELFGPYLAELARDAVRVGEPMLRHMAYQFPRNGFADCPDQFMLGSRYLIAPVLDSTDRRLVRFPKGVWYDAGGKRYKGPLVTEIAVAPDRLLYFEQRPAKGDK